MQFWAALILVVSWRFHDQTLLAASGSTRHCWDSGRKVNVTTATLLEWLHDWGSVHSLSHSPPLSPFWTLSRSAGESTPSPDPPDSAVPHAASRGRRGERQEEMGEVLMQRTVQRYWGDSYRVQRVGSLWEIAPNNVLHVTKVTINCRSALCSFYLWLQGSVMFTEHAINPAQQQTQAGSGVREWRSDKWGKL